MKRLCSVKTSKKMIVCNMEFHLISKNQLYTNEISMCNYFHTNRNEYIRLH
jgi:hypothetical protein